MHHANEVTLVGRLAAESESRTLPSGDELVTWRLIVERPSAPRRLRAPTVDTLDCVAWRADVRRRAASWKPGDILAISGSLRRRFWRSGGGPASRCEVEVRTARRLPRRHEAADGQP